MLIANQTWGLKMRVLWGNSWIRARKGAFLVLFVAAVFVFLCAVQPVSVKACLDEDDFGQLLQGLLCDSGDFGAVAAAGKFIFPLKWDFGDYEASVNFGSWASAYASVPDGLISLSVIGTGWGLGKLFDWSAGAIYDTYHFDTSVPLEDINVTIEYDGEIEGFAGFAAGLLGSGGFEFFGKVSPGTYDHEEWSISLLDIVDYDDATDGTFMMGFGALVFARGSDSFADFSDTARILFEDSEGNLVYTVESEGGFSQVPVPSSILLLGGGLIGLLGIRRRRKN